MHGETYRRNIDCDGDGHFDHVCEKPGHSGFISSREDCIDTWAEGTTGRVCDPRKTVELATTPNYTLVLDSGSCAPLNSAQCFKSNADWPRGTYPAKETCKFHVEAKGHNLPVIGTSSRDTQLYLEVLYEAIEKPVFKSTGVYYGDKFSQDQVILSPVIDKQDGNVLELLYPVFDQTSFQFTSDDSVQKEGWLVCLREKRNIPIVRVQISCSDIGDDIWSTFALAYEGVDKDMYVPVECDMSKCRKAAVTTVSPSSSVFLRTTNVCDAGWKVTRSNRFDVQFYSPQLTPGVAAADQLTIESSFMVLVAEIGALE